MGERLCRIFARIVGALMALCLCAPQVAAQVATASLVVRTVLGEGDVLPGVAVTVTNVETGAERAAVTGTAGHVLLSALPPGRYTVTAKLSGFEAPTAPETELRVGETVRIRLTLRPVVEETLDVSGEAPLVDVYRTEAAANVVPEQIRELPVIDRKFERLALLTPGVQGDRTEYFDRAGSPVVGAGATGDRTSFLVDGVELTDPLTGLARQRLSQDAVREFRVSRQGFDAELGGSASGVVSIVTHSGTNDLRGSAYGFYRADALRSRGALELEDADFTRSQFGISVGGPLTRDRAHYFASVEHLDDNRVAFVRPLGAFTDLAEDAAAPVEQTSALLALDHRFTDSSSGTAKLAWERYRQTNYDVGGVRDASHGWRWDRDAWTLFLAHTWVAGDNRLNELRGQLGSRDADFPANSDALGEFFSGGATLQTGGHWLGPDCFLRGQFAEIRDTYTWQSRGRRHQLKAGASWMHMDQSYKEDRFESGLLIYAKDDRTAPVIFSTGEGSSLVDQSTELVGVFVHDDWRPSSNLSIGIGLRYDLDTQGNNPDLEHPMVKGRTTDTDNIQPRVSFAWDLRGDGETVVRGGAGRFVDRYPYYPALMELQFNGETARTLFRRLSVPGYEIDPDDPENTGLLLAPDIILLDNEAPSPEAIQAGLGLTQRLGETGLRFEIDAVYVKGKNELAQVDSNWRGDDDACQEDGPDAFFTCRIDPNYTQIGRLSADGRSRYAALTVAVNGTLAGGHLLSASLTAAEKKNIFDVLGLYTMPSDPADAEAEWGRASTDERYRLVVSGVFRLPWRLTLAPIYEYGSGQPWNRVLGWDDNSDGEFTDRGEGVARNDQDGPRFSQLSLRLTKGFTFGQGELELMLEIFNLFDTTNYDVSSVVNTEYALDSTTGQMVPNPEFGTYTATLSPREIQLGLRYSF